MHVLRSLVDLAGQIELQGDGGGPWALTEVISVTPAIAPRRRSSGAETLDAMVSGSAPGRLAETRMVAKSTVGMLATGSVR